MCTADAADRAEALLALMSLEQKAGQLTQYFSFPRDFIAGLEGIDVDDVMSLEDLITAGKTGSVLFVRDPETADRLQRLAVERSPHGIPLLFGFDVIHGLRTIMPVGIALAATWAPAIAEHAQRVAAREARSAGIHWTFAPMIDVSRDPRWGRMVEGVGEDPFLGAAIAAAQVRGFQGDLGPENVLAGPKHFAGYGAARGGRDYEDVELSDAELWNVYFPPFQAAVRAGAATVMSAYMDLNGVPAVANRWLLTDVLRGMGFDGFVVSDANAVRSLQTQHLAADLTDAAVRALEAGLDMEMAMVDAAFARLPEAVASGRISEDVLDAAVRRVLMAKFAIGLFGQPYTDRTRYETVLADPSHRDVAEEAAVQSLVLLENDGLLPLDPSATSSIAVIGQLADSKRDTLGPWAFDYDIDETVTVLDGLRARLSGARITYAAGASIPERVFPSMFDDLDTTVATTPDDWDDDAAIEAAVTAAEQADVAIVVVGQRQNQSGEKASSSTLELPGRQLEQLERLVATGTPVIALVMSGRPLDLRWMKKHVPAIMQIWHPGTRGGAAVASVLVGDRSPAGRLPFTWPRHVGQVPVVLSHPRSFAPQEAAMRYWDEDSSALYPFGHGLSYASFRYTAIRLSRDRIAPGETVVVEADITNTSARDADEVVQLYIHQRHGTSSRPIRSLVGFERVTIDAGATTTVVFRLGPDELRYWSSVTRDWVQDSTVCDIWVGGTSQADLHTELTVSE